MAATEESIILAMRDVTPSLKIGMVCDLVPRLGSSINAAGILQELDTDRDRVMALFKISDHCRLIYDPEDILVCTRTVKSDEHRLSLVRNMGRQGPLLPEQTKQAILNTFGTYVNKTLARILLFPETREKKTCDDCGQNLNLEMTPTSMGIIPTHWCSVRLTHNRVSSTVVSPQEEKDKDPNIGIDSRIARTYTHTENSRHNSPSGHSAARAATTRQDKDENNSVNSKTQKHNDD